MRLASRTPEPRRSIIARLMANDLAYDFVRSPVAIVASLIFLAIAGAALCAPLIATTNPFDPASANVVDARLPPLSGGLFGDWYPLGTDPQGRDMLSAILYGTRTSLLVGLAAVLFAATLGLTLGLVAGYFGGLIDALIMRVADVQLSFPAILVALLVDGVARTVVGRGAHEEIALFVLVFAIGISNWVQYARTVRSVAMVERKREYVEGALVTGVHPARIIVGHILPNVMGPVTVIATISLALAIITESTLSFLGVGVPPTQPSLGTLVRIGNEYLFSGSWWITIFPGAVLLLLALSVNLVGDWLRDALNPRLS